MDSLITAAARALAAGDPLGALKRVALRDDAPALALRGIAMAQLGDLVRAKALVRSAARAFLCAKKAVARARCIVAEAEIALASRDLGLAGEGARSRAGDARSAWRPSERRACAGISRSGALLLIGRASARPGAGCAGLDPAPLLPALKCRPRAVVVAGIAMLDACGPRRRALRSSGRGAPRAVPRILR